MMRTVAELDLEGVPELVAEAAAEAAQDLGGLA
jgi:hypothetical protein